MSEEPDDPCVCGHTRDQHSGNGFCYVNGILFMSKDGMALPCKCKFALDPEMVKVRVCVGLFRPYEDEGKMIRNDYQASDQEANVWGYLIYKKVWIEQWVDPRKPSEGRAGEG